MYKNRNTGTGNGMRGTRGMGKNVIFRGISANIPGNVAKLSGECPQTFRGMSSNIPRNVLKHSGECPQTLQGMSPNIPGNVVKHSGECRQHFGECRKTFPGMSSDIRGNVTKHSGECPQIFRGMFLCRIAFIHQFCGNKKNTFRFSGNQPRTITIRPRCNNHYATVNQWDFQTYQVEFQLTLYMTLFHAITTHSLANNILPTLQKTKLDILPLLLLLFYKGFTISKLTSFPFWETVADHEMGVCFAARNWLFRVNRTRTSAVRARRHNHLAAGNCCILPTYQVELQPALKKDFASCYRHPSTN